jgi:hypothetical protein
MNERALQNIKYLSAKFSSTTDVPIPGVGKNKNTAVTVTVYVRTFHPSPFQRQQEVDSLRGFLIGVEYSSV